MKKLKLDFGEGGFKGWLALHVEKVVLGLVLLILVLLVYSGASLDGYDKTPQNLSQVAASATNNIQRDSTREIVESVPPPTFTQVKNVNIPRENSFAGPIVVPKRVGMSMLRGDPVLLPPVKLEVHADVAPLLVKGATTRVDPFAADEPAMFAPEEQQGPQRRRSGRGRDEDEDGRDREPSSHLAVGRPKLLSQSFKKNLPGFHFGNDGFAESRAVVSINALVEYEKQVEQFNLALTGSRSDRKESAEPNYVFFRFERCEVVDGQDQPWQPVGNMATVKRAEEQYGAPAERLVPQKYTLPETITRPIAPLLLVDLNKIGTHSALPGMYEESAAADARPAASEDDERPIADFPTAQPKRDDDAAHASSVHASPGVSRGNEPQTPITEFKLLRFYDFTVEPGKQYRYRVHVLLEDPNHPIKETGREWTRPFAPDVIKRLRDVIAQERQTGRRIYYRTTEWSEPSDVVRVPVVEGLLAGSVKRGRMRRVGDEEFESEPPTAEVLQVKWDWNRAAPVAGLKKMMPGGSLRSPGLDAEVMHPVKRELRVVKNYPFDNEGVVLDMRGGRELPVPKEQPDLSPGEVIVMDKDGNLQVRNELDDVDAYRRQLFLDAIETAGPRRGAEPPSPARDGGGIHGGRSAADDLLKKD